MSGARLAVLALGWLVLPTPPAAPAEATLQLFFDAASTDARKADAALREIARSWKNSYTPLLVDLARFLPSTSASAGADRDLLAVLPDDPDQRVAETDTRRVSSPASQARLRLIRFLEKQTSQRFGDDLGRWREWMWRLDYDPHPDHLAFKATLYGRVDPRMSRFFAPNVDGSARRATIRLDEIDWGGVKVNGIPPLVSPAVVPASQAVWLKDSHLVFGVEVGREARAYPRRILAWHEMAHDRLGGERLTIVYCTLCGTVIPYRSSVGGVHRTFGTSGLLYRSNKLMFDAETMSLWSTLDGRPVVGPLAGSDLTLDFLPVVTTTWGEWRRAHPTTTVLSIATGHDRDYSEGAAYREYLSTDRLMFRVPVSDKRLKNKDEVLGLLLPARGGGRQAVAFSADFLARTPIFHTTHEGVALVVLTTSHGANRVFESGATRFARWMDESSVVDTSGRRWQVTESALIAQDPGTPMTLVRRPAFRAFWFGWFAQFPETELVK
jgi:hypothetical protein